MWVMWLCFGIGFDSLLWDRSRYLRAYSSSSMKKSKQWITFIHAFIHTYILLFKDTYFYHILWSRKFLHEHFTFWYYYNACCMYLLYVHMYLQYICIACTNMYIIFLCMNVMSNESIIACFYYFQNCDSNNIEWISLGTVWRPSCSWPGETSAEFWISYRPRKWLTQRSTKKQVRSS